MNNILHPTEEELQQPYLQNFWINPTDPVYTGPPVLFIEARQSPVEEPVHATSTAAQEPMPSTSSTQHTVHTQQLEAKIDEMRTEMDVMRTEMHTMRAQIGDELRQHRSEIQTMMRQFLEYVTPKVFSITYTKYPYYRYGCKLINP